MKYFLGAMGVVTLLLGGIGTMNVMLVAVRERTREIGLRKALGATSRGILGMFFLETLMIVLFSGGAGLAFAHAVCAAVNTLPMPKYFAGLWATWEVGVFCVVLLGLVAARRSIRHRGRRRSTRGGAALRGGRVSRSAEGGSDQAWDALRRNPTRNLLTMLGIVWDIAAVTLLLSYGTSSER